MPAQYSDSPPLLLAVDSGSPRISVAVGRPGEPLAVRDVRNARSSPSLLRLIDECLAEAGATVVDLDRLIGLRGPGSFTGLRVGLATLLGLQATLGIAATAIPTFDALAWQAAGRSQRIVALVDALRGEWFSRVYEGLAPPSPVEPPLLRTPKELRSLAPATLVGFALDPLAELEGHQSGLACFNPEPLAPTVIEHLPIDETAWDPGLLTRPLYLRPPAATRPG